MPHHLFGGLQQIAHHAHTEVPTLAARPFAGITEFSLEGEPRSSIKST